MHRVIFPLLALFAALAGHLMVSYTSTPAASYALVEVSEDEPAKPAAADNTGVEAERVPLPGEAKYRLPAEARVRFVEFQVVPTLCGAPHIPTIIACVDDIGGSVMTLPNPCADEFIGEDYAAVVCHEKGHILGWRHEMPSFFPAPEKG